MEVKTIDVEALRTNLTEWETQEKKLAEQLTYTQEQVRKYRDVLDVIGEIHTLHGIRPVDAYRTSRQEWISSVLTETPTHFDDIYLQMRAKGWAEGCTKKDLYMSLYYGAKGKNPRYKFYGDGRFSVVTRTSSFSEAEEVARAAIGTFQS